MILPRRKFTTAVVTHVRTTTEKPCGDAEAPDGGGWQGEVGDSNFIPYTVITPMDSEQGDGPSSDPQVDVVWNYAITSFGVSRDQCEWISDLAKQGVLSMKRQTIELRTGLSCKVLTTNISSYGGVDRGGQEPPWYAQTDVVSISVTPA